MLSTNCLMFICIKLINLKSNYHEIYDEFFISFRLQLTSTDSVKCSSLPRTQSRKKIEKAGKVNENGKIIMWGEFLITAKREKNIFTLVKEIILMS